jgi:hypothetical protein
MTDLIANMSEFLSEVKNHFPNFYIIKENTDGKLIISVTHEVLADADKCVPFIRFLIPMIKRLRLTEYIAQEFLKASNPEFNGAPMVVGLEYRIDRTSLFIDQLKEYFAPSITKTEIAQAIGFLLNNGWTEREFQSEIGLSRATLYRYQNEAKKSV